MTAPREHVTIADAIDSAMFVIQDLKTGNGIVTSDRLADAVIAALNAAGFVIVSGDYKREIENAAFERAAQLAQDCFPPAHTYASENGDLYAAQDSASRIIASAIRALITPAKTADTEG